MDLIVNPKELEVDFFDQPTSFTLDNTSSKNVVLYKIRRNNPKVLSFEPLAGIVEPNKSTTISVKFTEDQVSHGVLCVKYVTIERKKLGKNFTDAWDLGEKTLNGTQKIFVDIRNLSVQDFDNDDDATLDEVGVSSPIAMEVPGFESVSPNSHFSKNANSNKDNVRTPSAGPSTDGMKSTSPSPVKMQDLIEDDNLKSIANDDSNVKIEAPIESDEPVSFLITKNEQDKEDEDNYSEKDFEIDDDNNINNDVNIVTAEDDEDDDDEGDDITANTNDTGGVNDSVASSKFSDMKAPQTKTNSKNNEYHTAAGNNNNSSSNAFTNAAKEAALNRSVQLSAINEYGSREIPRTSYSQVSLECSSSRSIGFSPPLYRVEVCGNVVTNDVCYDALRIRTSEHIVKKERVVGVRIHDCKVDDLATTIGSLFKTPDLLSPKKKNITTTIFNKDNYNENVVPNEGKNHSNVEELEESFTVDTLIAATKTSTTHKDKALVREVDELRGRIFDESIRLIAISRTLITSFDSTLNRFHNLTKLDLSNNKIQHLHGKIILPNLEVLDMSYNSIRSLDFLQYLINLRQLNVSYNELSNVHSTIHMLIPLSETLVTLDLRYNIVTAHPQYAFTTIDILKKLRHFDGRDLVEFSEMYTHAKGSRFQMSKIHNELPVGHIHWDRNLVHQNFHGNRRRHHRPLDGSLGPGPALPHELEKTNENNDNNGRSSSGMRPRIGLTGNLLHAFSGRDEGALSSKAMPDSFWDRANLDFDLRLRRAVSNLHRSRQEQLAQKDPKSAISEKVLATLELGANNSDDMNNDDTTGEVNLKDVEELLRSSLNIEQALFSSDDVFRDKSTYSEPVLVDIIDLAPHERARVDSSFRKSNRGGNPSTPDRNHHMNRSKRPNYLSHTTKSAGKRRNKDGSLMKSGIRRKKNLGINNTSKNLNYSYASDSELTNRRGRMAAHAFVRGLNLTVDTKKDENNQSNGMNITNKIDGNDLSAFMDGNDYDSVMNMSITERSIRSLGSLSVGSRRSSSAPPRHPSSFDSAVARLRAGKTSPQRRSSTWGNATTGRLIATTKKGQISIKKEELAHKKMMETIALTGEKGKVNESLGIGGVGANTSRPHSPGGSSISSRGSIRRSVSSPSSRPNSRQSMHRNPSLGSSPIHYFDKDGRVQHINDSNIIINNIDENISENNDMMEEQNQEYGSNSNNNHVSSIQATTVTTTNVGNDGDMNSTSPSVALTGLFPVVETAGDEDEEDDEIEDVTLEGDKVTALAEEAVGAAGEALGMGKNLYMDTSFEVAEFPENNPGSRNTNTNTNTNTDINTNSRIGKGPPRSHTNTTSTSVSKPSFMSGTAALRGRRQSYMVQQGDSQAKALSLSKMNRKPVVSGASYYSNNRIQTINQKAPQQQHDISFESVDSTGNKRKTKKGKKKRKKASNNAKQTLQRLMDAARSSGAVVISNSGSRSMTRRSIDATNIGVSVVHNGAGVTGGVPTGARFMLGTKSGSTKRMSYINAQGIQLKENKTDLFRDSLRSGSIASKAKTNDPNLPKGYASAVNRARSAPRVAMKRGSFMLSATGRNDSSDTLSTSGSGSGFTVSPRSFGSGNLTLRQTQQTQHTHQNRSRSTSNGRVASRVRSRMAAHQHQEYQRHLSQQRVHSFDPSISMHSSSRSDTYDANAYQDDMDVSTSNDEYASTKTYFRSQSANSRNRNKNLNGDYDGINTNANTTINGNNNSPSIFALAAGGPPMTHTVNGELLGFNEWEGQQSRHTSSPSNINSRVQSMDITDLVHTEHDIDHDDNDFRTQARNSMGSEGAASRVSSLSGPSPMRQQQQRPMNRNYHDSEVPDAEGDIDRNIDNGRDYRYGHQLGEGALPVPKYDDNNTDVTNENSALGNNDDSDDEDEDKDDAEQALALQRFKQWMKTTTGYDWQGDDNDDNDREVGEDTPIPDVEPASPAHTHATIHSDIAYGLGPLGSPNPEADRVINESLQRSGLKGGVSMTHPRELALKAAKSSPESISNKDNKNNPISSIMGRPRTSQHQ